MGSLRVPPDPTLPRRRRELDRAAERYLEREIAPALRREHLDPVARAVQRTLSHGSLVGLNRLPERQRRALLRTIERRMTRRPRPAPEVLVRLTAAIAASHPDEPGAPYPVALPVR
jgi:hypothetical protein